MAWWFVVFLGVLQGLTEFLPISSSAHLRLAQIAFGLEAPQTLFDVCLHVGTLVAVCIVCWLPIKQMLAGLMRFTWNDVGFRLVILVGIATVPTAILGVLLGHWLEGHTAHETAF